MVRLLYLFEILYIKKLCFQNSGNTPHHGLSLKQPSQNIKKKKNNFQFNVNDGKPSILLHKQYSIGYVMFPFLPGFVEFL